MNLLRWSTPELTLTFTTPLLPHDDDISRRPDVLDLDHEPVPDEVDLGR